jgi:hypothetical protein
VRERERERNSKRMSGRKRKCMGEYKEQKKVFVILSEKEIDTVTLIYIERERERESYID